MTTTPQEATPSPPAPQLATPTEAVARATPLPVVPTRTVLGAVNQNPSGIGLFALLREDLRTHENDLFSQGFWALAVHRFGNWRMSVRPKVFRFPFTLLYRFLNKWVEILCGIKLSYTVKVGRRVHIWHFGGMILGARAIGDDVHLRQNTTLGVARRGDDPIKKPTLEDRCDIGAGAVLAGGITIGHDSVVGANAVVLHDVPPYSVAVGIPAKVIKTRIPMEAIAQATHCTPNGGQAS